MAAISKTPRQGCWIGFSGAVGSIKSIDSLGVSMRQPIGSPSLEIRNVSLTMNAMDTIFGPVPLVDEFGQWIPSDWPGKARSLNDLDTAWSEEDKELDRSISDVSEYGGFSELKEKGTGFFRVEQINGRWWFIDPEGCCFFSTGTTGIGVRSEFARVSGREYIFKELPPSGDISASASTAAQIAGNEPFPIINANYSFYSWNLYRRFGTDWYLKWINYTFKRMDSWGMNTIANWSDTTLGRSQKKAYVATLRGWGIETGIMGMPDVYDPDYQEMVDRTAARQCAFRRNDPWLLGYFIGNEPPWPNREMELVNAILTGDNSPMQDELKKYLAKEDSPEQRKVFVYDTYRRFIRIVNAAIKKYDPNHLNLGFRFGGSAPDEIIKESDGFDVFSFNNYGYSVNQDFVKRVNDLTGLPVIIGEFHFGVPERGLAPGLAQAANQSERGAAYRYYVENAAANPAVIGTHWFQWIDQPPTGRYDGENYNIGFVDVTDRPYKELISAARETHKRIAGIHSGKIMPVTRQALIK